MSDEIVRIERPDPPAEIWVSILKSAFGAVPLVGQALMEVVFDGRSRVKQDRINLFLKETADTIHREKVDYTFLKSDEFSDHLEDILIRAAKNNSENKRGYFKNLLVAAIHGERPPDLSRVFLDVLSEITDQEVLLLAKFYVISKQEPDSQNPLNLKLDKERVESLGFDYKDFVLLLQSMIRKGLLYDDGPGRWGIRPHELIRITELGVRFYEYVTYK